MENMKMNVVRDGLPNLRFSGTKIADVSSHSHQGSQQNRWTEIKIYRTAAGKSVVKIIGRTCWQGERDRHEAHVCADEAAVITALTQDHESGDGAYLSDLAKEALEQAGIECVEEIA
jgi:EXLDI family protein